MEGGEWGLGRGLGLVGIGFEIGLRLCGERVVVAVEVCEEGVEEA